MSLSLDHLRCDYLVEPRGLDEPVPRLSWRLVTDRRGARQVARRIRVATTPELLAADTPDLWDSGRIEDDRTTQLDYAGRPLSSREVCHWQVEAWDETGASVRSAPACWTMGLLDASDWTARWIAADPAIIARDPEAVAPTLTEPGTPAHFRRAFDLPGPVRRATLYVSARGLFECTANGHRVGEDVFAPEWTDYHTRIHYRAYDVTALLAPGANVVGALLGDGWWSGYIGWQKTRGRYGSLENSLLAQLEIELADGRRMVVGTDSDWTCDTGPILFGDLQWGETHDARREQPGWDRPGFVPPADRPWLPVREVAPPAARLVAQRSEPVRAMETFTPVTRAEPAPGVWVYDLGQNIAGRVRLRVHGAAGTRVVLRHAERLNPDGTLYVANLRKARATDTYILCGDPAGETWEPRFTWHGFQYVEITGLAEPPDVTDVTGVVIRSATPGAGRFACSHPGVERLWKNALWSQRDNFLSVPTDCPQRDERLGWMGDAQVFIRTATCNHDVAAFFTKWMLDVEDAQTPDGLFPDIAPRPPEDERHNGLDDLCGGPGWADAGIIVPWTLWRVYGDTRVIARHWAAMVAWLDYLERTNPDHLRTRDLRNNYGDWLCLSSDTQFRVGSPMKDFLASAYWADDAAKLAAMARALGRADDAARFTAMADRVKAAIRERFVLPDGRLAVETQTSYLLALAFDLLPAALRAPAADRLVELIRAEDWHLNTGFIGISHLNPTLTAIGRADVAYRLLLQETYPGWLYPVRHGATTIWERWNGWTEEGGFESPSMNSFNHYSLGSVGEWLFRHVAGIELDPDHAGFQRFVLRPHPGAGLDHAEAVQETAHGAITSAWRLDGDAFGWTITVPANTRARIWLPSEPDTPAETDGLGEFAREGRWLVGDAPAGTYRLRSVCHVAALKE